MTDSPVEPSSFSHAPLPGAASCWCIFNDGQLVLLNQRLPDSKAETWPLTNRIFLGTAQGQNFFLADLISMPNAAIQSVSLRSALLGLPIDLTPILVRAAQIRYFQRTHRYCGRCAFPLTQNHHDAGRYCPSCQQRYYPALSPAMMVAIYRNKELLLARGSHFLPGVYSALAGFVEPGETVEQCVHREVMEEVGVRIHRLRYICSQSWPFPHSLMLAFTAEFMEGDICIQQDELEDAKWFSIDQLPPLPFAPSVAAKLLHYTVNWLKEGAASI